MTGRIHRDTDYFALKAATRRACEQSGRLDDSAERTRVSKAQLSKYGDPKEPGANFVPLDVAADLDAMAGDPVLARALAAVAGYDLVPMSAMPATDTHLGHLGSIAREAGEVMAGLADSLADGTVTPAEALQLDKDAAELIAALDAWRLTLHTTILKGA